MYLFCVLNLISNMIQKLQQEAAPQLKDWCDKEIVEPIARLFVLGLGALLFFWVTMPRNAWLPPPPSTMSYLKRVSIEITEIEDI